MDKKIILCVRTAIEMVIEVGTVKPVFSGHSKIDRTKVLRTHGSLTKVESIAECFDLHSAIIGLENQFRSSF